jgi:ribosomal-protein-serine acetyltransferase
MENPTLTMLTDGTITLRPITIDDADALYEAASSSIPEMHPWMPWCHPEYTRAESRSWITWQEEQWRNGIEYAFAIVESASGRYLGGVGINQISRMHRFANLGYWVRSDATGRGIATRATALTALYGFTELGLNRIEILASIENLASQRVAERSGAQREGVLRRRLWLHGRAHDAVMYSLVREEAIG